MKTENGLLSLLKVSLKLPQLENSTSLTYLSVSTKLIKLLLSFTKELICSRKLGKIRIGKRLLEESLQELLLFSNLSKLFQFVRLLIPKLQTGPNSTKLLMLLRPQIN